VVPAPSPRSRAASGVIGKGAPTFVETAGRDGGWVVFCQAREDTDKNGAIEVSVNQNGMLAGDRMQRFLAIGSGDGEAIDELAAWDPSGKWIVVRRSGSLTLVDTWTRKETDLLALGADPDADRLSYREHRALSFDGAGTNLLYLGKRDGVVRGVVHALGAHTEHVIDPGLPNVWRAALDRSGHWASFLGYSNEMGAKSWPAPRAEGAPPCRAPIDRYNAWVGRGETPVRTLAATTENKAVLAQSFVMALGEARVLREPDGRLLLQRAGKNTELSSAQCGAKILHADAARTRLLVACATPKGRPKLEIVGVGERVELGVDIALAPEDRAPAEPVRLVPVYPGTASALVDLEQKKLVPLKDGDVIIVTHAALALVRRGKRLLVVGAEAKERDLALEVDTLPDTITNGALAVASPFVIDLSTANPVLGKTTGRPLALAPDGQVLVAKSRTPEGLFDGPLEWKRPIPSHPPPPLKN
jgi:hypothetical protein